MFVLQGIINFYSSSLYGPLDSVEKDKNIIRQRKGYFERVGLVREVGQVVNRP